MIGSLISVLGIVFYNTCVLHITNRLVNQAFANIKILKNLGNLGLTITINRAFQRKIRESKLVDHLNNSTLSIIHQIWN